MSESTMGKDEQAKAVERRSVVEEKLRHDVREMLEVLKADIPVFFAREAKKRFVAAPELAERLSKEQLAKVKKDLQAAAEKTAAEVVRALEDPRTWAWDAGKPLPEDPKSLDPHPRVSAVIARAGAGLAATLAQLGFPDAESAKEGYKLPSYFIAGRFMKQLVESYWRNLSEVVELGRLIDESSTRERRERLSKKWDES
jgi:hypothetical protein